MRVDVNFYGTVPMPDAGDGGPRPVDRRCSNADVVTTYQNLVSWCETADALGYDTVWFTEHHFQHEGYEVTPNLIQFGVHCAGRTRNLRFGQMFNVVPQWHPLRLAEDFAAADILTGGRMELGVGRGTVPREAWSLGTVVASGDNDLSREADQTNREIFEEAMAVITMAWEHETFSFQGRHFRLPPPGIPDRGRGVEHLTLVPRPTRPIPIYQPISSPATAEYAARAGHRGVFFLQPPAALHARWDAFGTLAVAAGRVMTGADRVLVLVVHVGATREAAIARARPAWDEFTKFLGQYGRFRHLVLPGTPDAPFDYRPSIESAVDLGAIAVGSADDVAGQIAMLRDLLGLEHLCVFLELPGFTRGEIDEQLHLVAEDVMPRLGVGMTAGAAV